MKFYPITVLFLVGCSPNPSLETLNTFHPVSAKEIAQLDSINQIILRNAAIVIEASNAMFSHLPEEFNKIPPELYATSPATLERHLPRQDFLAIDKYAAAFSKGTYDKLSVERIEFRTSDSTFQYDLRMDFYESSKQDISVHHFLLFRTKPGNYTRYKDESLAREKQASKNWTYYIRNTPYTGR